MSKNKNKKSDNMEPTPIYLKMKDGTKFPFVNSMLYENVTLQHVCKVAKNEKEKANGNFKQVTTNIVLLKGLSFDAIVGKLISALTISAQKQMRKSYDTLSDFGTWDFTYSEKQKLAPKDKISNMANKLSTRDKSDLVVNMIDTLKSAARDGSEEALQALNDLGISID